MHQDAEISISKYARICNTKYAENMHNMHKRNMKNICFICQYIQQYANPKYAFICKYPYANICRKYVEICKNRICTNMHF